jgi:hypothetical protein
MKYFLDTEFIEAGHTQPITLLSLGIHAEDGRDFYVVNEDADLSKANDWVKENVLPHLGDPKVSFHTIGPNIVKWLNDEKPEFWGYYADYDWVVFCQIFGSMINLPSYFPMFCRDIKQLAMDKGNPKLPPQDSTEHNALNDAIWNFKAWAYLTQL